MNDPAARPQGIQQKQKIFVLRNLRFLKHFPAWKPCSKTTGNNQDLKVFFPNVKSNSLYKTITRWTKKGVIIKLKKGYYVTKEYAEKHNAKKEYWYYLGNILRYPSYVSGVYALQHYNIRDGSINSVEK